MIDKFQCAGTRRSKVLMQLTPRGSAPSIGLRDASPRPKSTSGVPLRGNFEPEAESKSPRSALSVREMGGAPRNPAPRNHFLVWIVKPSGWNCTDALGGEKTIVEGRPLLGTLPLSLISGRTRRPTFAAQGPAGGPLGNL